jgi:hypothetical protein
MLLDEAAQARHDIDFLNPRRRPKPPSKNRQFALMGATAATLVLAAAFLVWHNQSQQDQQIRTLQKEVNDLNKLVDVAKKLQARAEDIDAFAVGDVTWLEELKEVSEELPSGERILVSRLAMGSKPAGGGTIDLDGFAMSPEDLSSMIRRLQDERHTPIPKGRREDNYYADYPWRFDRVTIHVAPPDLDGAPASNP